MKEKVLKALGEVIDPETGIDVVKMDMVKSVTVKGDEAEIRFVPTTPFCPMIGYLVEQIEKAAKSVKGIRKVSVKVG